MCVFVSPKKKKKNSFFFLKNHRHKYKKCNHKSTIFIIKKTEKPQIHKSRDKKQPN